MCFEQVVHRGPGDSNTPLLAQRRNYGIGGGWHTTYLFRDTIAIVINDNLKDVSDFAQLQGLPAMKR